MKFRKFTLALTAAAVLWAVASVVAMTSGVLVNWPDYVHTNFGIPFTFAVHTSSTITGPVDSWDMDLNALTADLTFWLIGMVVITIAGLARNPKVAIAAPQGAD